MKITIETPTKAYLKDYSSSELEEIRNHFKYIRSDIIFQIKKLKEMSWFKRNNPEAFEMRLNELESQRVGYLTFKDEKGYYIRTGSIHYLPHNYEIISNIHYPTPKPLKWAKKIEFEPYKYQSDSVEELLKIKHGNISLPTGAGKSLCLVLLAQRLGLRTVVVTPSQSIFNELLDEFTERFGKDKVGGYGDGKKDLKKPITIAIGKSLTMIKEGSEAEKFFKNKEVMEIDESHTFGADQLEKVSQTLLSDVPYRFFVSATQTRNNGTAKVLESIIGKCVYDMSIEDAINGKYLCPLKFSILEVFSPSTSTTTDPLEAKRKHFLYNPQIAEKIAAIIHKVTQERKSVLVLVDELYQISLLSKLLKVPHSYVHSGSKKDAEKWGLTVVKQKEELLKFNKGEVRVLIGTKAIATGTNIFPTHVVCNWSGGSSEIVTKQGAVGRSTRKLDISKYAEYHAPKPFSMIVDFDVKNQPLLNNQLNKRIDFYGESGGEIKHIKT